MGGEGNEASHDMTRVGLRPRDGWGAPRCSTKCLGGPERGLSCSAAETHQTGETSPSEVSVSSDGVAAEGWVFAKTVKLAVVRRGRWGLGAQERTRPPKEMGDGGAVELATSDSVAVGDLRAGRG
jgi:hypothetical protein